MTCYDEDPSASDYIVCLTIFLTSQSVATNVLLANLPALGASDHVGYMTQLALI